MDSASMQMVASGKVVVANESPLGLSLFLPFTLVKDHDTID